MTTRALLFDSPFLLGFDHTRALIDRAAKAAAESYPPYNVEQIGDAGVRITLAVAGFSPEELNVTLEGRQLTVAGQAPGPPLSAPAATSCPTLDAKRYPSPRDPDPQATAHTTHAPIRLPGSA